MEEFEKEGTSKLKETFEDKLGDLIDRLQALTGDDCLYNSFSGKSDDMDGNVKFIIESAPIEKKSE